MSAFLIGDKFFMFVHSLPRFAMDVLKFQEGTYRAIREINEDGVWAEAFNFHNYELHTLWHTSQRKVIVFFSVKHQKKQKKTIIACSMR